MKIGLKLLDIRTKKTFIKYFDTEYKRDLFIRKSRYFKNILILEKECNYV